MHFCETTILFHLRLLIFCLFQPDPQFNASAVHNHKYKLPPLHILALYVEKLKFPVQVLLCMLRDLGHYQFDNEREHARQHSWKVIDVYKRALSRCHMICTRLYLFRLAVCCRC
ncbi:hypothetical protein SLE2022_249920 [Rubroshorea leprosula]